MRKTALISRLSLLGFAMLVLFSGALAQETGRTITGTVLNASGLPLAGATVSFKDDANAVTTNAEGKFSLPQVSGKTTLVISYVGYITREVAVGSGTLEIRLSENPSELSNVVVIGYGTARKSDLTGSVVSVR